MRRRLIIEPFRGKIPSETFGEVIVPPVSSQRRVLSRSVAFYAALGDRAVWVPRLCVAGPEENGTVKDGKSSERDDPGEGGDMD